MEMEASLAFYRAVFGWGHASHAGGHPAGVPQE